MADFSLADGSTLREPRVLSVDAGFVTFQHRGGVRRVAIVDLPEIYQKYFPFNPDVAQEQIMREAASEHHLALMRERRLTAESIEKSGFFGHLIYQGTWDQEAVCALRYETMGTEKFRQYKTVPLGQEGGFTEIEKPAKKTVTEPAVFVIGLPDEAFRSGKWSGRLYPAGEMEIPDQNSDKMMRLKRFTLDANRAAELLHPNTFFVPPIPATASAPVSTRENRGKAGLEGPRVMVPSGPQP